MPLFRSRKPARGRFTQKYDKNKARAKKLAQLKKTRANRRAAARKRTAFKKSAHYTAFAALRRRGLPLGLVGKAIGYSHRGNWRSQAATRKFR